MANQFADEELQLKTLGPLKSVSERSDFLRRILATKYLLSGSARAEVAGRSQWQSLSTPSTPLSTMSEDVTPSNGSTPIVVEHLVRDHTSLSYLTSVSYSCYLQDILYPISIEMQLEPLVRSHRLFGFRSHELNVQRLSCVIHLLSTALGDDEEEFKQQRVINSNIIRSTCDTFLIRNVSMCFLYSIRFLSKISYDLYNICPKKLVTCRYSGE